MMDFDGVTNEFIFRWDMPARASFCARFLGRLQAAHYPLQKVDMQSILYECWHGVDEEIKKSQAEMFQKIEEEIHGPGHSS